MPEYRDGLGGLSDVARSLNDEEWERKKAEARSDIRVATDEIVRQADRLNESVAELSGGTVTRIHQEPTAEVALTEDELRYLVEAVDERGFKEMQHRPESKTAFDKLSQLLAIESGPGGRFSGDTAA